MLALWLNTWSTDASGWSIADIWRYADVVEHAIYLSLAVMLGYTVFVLVRFLRNYRLARREFCDLESESSSPSCRHGTEIIAHLSRGLGVLRCIAFAAPFLGLAGTSYGILAALYQLFAWRSRLSNFLSERLVTTILGIVVAVPAIVVYNFLCACVERQTKRYDKKTLPKTDLGSFQFAQTLPLRRRFSGPPAFALIAAPVAACTLMVYMGFRAHPMPTGLRVPLLPIGTLDPGGGLTDQVVVSILSRRNALPIIRVNSEEIPLDNLEDAVRARLRPLTSCQAYVEADSAGYFKYVADVIDRMKPLHCQVFLLTTTPAPQAKRGSRERAKIPIAHP